RDLLPSLAPQETLTFLARVSSETSDLLVDEYLKLLPQESLGTYVPKERMPKWQNECGRGFLALAPRLTGDREKTLRSLASGSLAQNLQFIYELTRLPEGIKRFLTPEALSAAVARLEANMSLKDDGGLQHTFPSALWARGLLVATDANVEEFLQRVTSLLVNIPLDPSAPGLQPLML